MSGSRKTRRAAALIAAACMVLSAAACGDSVQQVQDNSAPAESAPAESTTTAKTTKAPVLVTTTTTTLPPLPVMEEYAEEKGMYEDMVGWIKVEGTPIDYPCVQGKDNKYYLEHNFKKEEERNGACFVDYLCDFSNTRVRPANIIIYGHNMMKGPSFAKLTTYCPWYKVGGYTSNMSLLNLEQYNTAPTVTFDTIWEKGTYKVFAAMYVNTQEEHGEVFKYYKQRTIANEGEFYDYIGKIMDRSLFYTDVDLEYGDELLTLSTCYYPLGNNIDTRFVVFARRVREGESAEVDTSKAYINPSPLYFDYLYKVYGGSWQGRNWDTTKVKGFDEYYASHETTAPADASQTTAAAE